MRLATFLPPANDGTACRSKEYLKLRNSAEELVGQKNLKLGALVPPLVWSERECGLNPTLERVSAVILVMRILKLGLQLLPPAKVVTVAHLQ